VFTTRQHSHPFSEASVQTFSLKEFLYAADFVRVRCAGFYRARLVVAIAVGFALGGCGNTSNNPISNGNRASVEANLTALNASMTIAFTSNRGSLPQLTQEYITAVQNGESLLGADEARQKLSTTASQVAPYCAACVQSLNTAIAQIGQ
jgi:hypothetical protein